VVEHNLLCRQLIVVTMNVCYSEFVVYAFIESIDIMNARLLFRICCVFCWLINVMTIILLLFTIGCVLCSFDELL
jgi:hypothetical protein